MHFNGSRELLSNLQLLFSLVELIIIFQPFDFFSATIKPTARTGTQGGKHTLFTAALPLGLAPESQMLNAKFVTKVVVREVA